MIRGNLITKQVDIKAVIILQQSSYKIEGEFNMTNARNVVEDAFITKTRNNFNFHDGNFHFEFSATLITY